MVLLKPFLFYLFFSKLHNWQCNCWVFFWNVGKSSGGVVNCRYAGGRTWVRWSIGDDRLTHWCWCITERSTARAGAHSLCSSLCCFGNKRCTSVADYVCNRFSSSTRPLVTGHIIWWRCVMLWTSHNSCVWNILSASSGLVSEKLSKLWKVCT